MVLHQAGDSVQSMHRNINPHNQTRRAKHRFHNFWNMLSWSTYQMIRRDQLYVINNENAYKTMELLRLSETLSSDEFISTPKARFESAGSMEDFMLRHVPKS